MISYSIAGMTVTAERPLPSPFSGFEREGGGERVCVSFAGSPFASDGALERISHAGFDVLHMPEGWLYLSPDAQLRASEDYRELYAYCGSDDQLAHLLRLALECRTALVGGISLHAACIDCGGQAVAFSGISGMGKSTRAGAWVEALGAEWISGDRPTVYPAERTAYGVPWDGKELIFRPVSRPLAAIFEVRRSEFTRIRRMSGAQSMRFLAGQCFFPMWDTSISAVTFVNLRSLVASVPVYRLFCGPDGSAAREAHDILFDNPEQILTEDRDVRLKEGFAVRSVAGEHLAMPTGENIKKFGGSVVLNEVSAFIVGHLQKGISRADLVDLILAEYDVEKSVAESDLDALIARLDEYGMMDSTAD